MHEVVNEKSLREMTPRVRMLFERINSRKYQKQTAFGGNLNVINERTKRHSVGYRRSLAAEIVLNTMPVSIEPGDLIVGNCVTDSHIVRCMLPRFLLNEEIGQESVRLSHKCPNYEKLLRSGLLQMIDEVDETIVDCTDERWVELAEAMKREAYAVVKLANRYANLAEKMAKEADNSQDLKDLKRISEVCRKVPAYPAESFQEALQAIWMVNHAFRETEAALSIGCIDRIVYPFLKSDYEKGAITLDEAQELVDCFYLRVNDRTQMNPANYVVNPDDVEGITQQAAPCYDTGFVMSAESDEADAINHWGQNILLSGILPTHLDGTNALTYMFLNSLEKFKMTSPVITVRVHKNTPLCLLKRVSEVLKQSSGMPYINNDDVIIPAYEALGVSFVDASNYANSNCWETLLQGTSSQEMIRGVNFLYFLELALNRGKSTIYANQLANSRGIDLSNNRTWPAYVCIGNRTVDGIDTGSPSSFRTFQDLMRAWKTQLDFVVYTTMRTVASFVREKGNMGPGTTMPLASMLQEDCVARRRDVTHLGARYNLWHVMAEAVSNAADALYAIKKLVFEEEKMDIIELVEYLHKNWPGDDGENLRLMLQNTLEKFGNDNDEVDGIAAEMVDYFVKRVRYHAHEYKDEFVFSPCIGTFSWIISIGKRIGASADGRMEQEAIASNMSPVPGRDVSGPIAAINSYMKLDLSSMAAGAPIDIRISSNGLEGEEGTSRVSGLIKTFIDRGGNMLTLTITSVEELRKAMANPKDYGGLRVRMGGWSAYFTMLSKESQKIHLKRVEHGLA